ncbi:polysaccharide biosynthesis tyrosine autokinase [Apibacter raozihei]|uniref:GumC family protein n=1 Tax=Apibacter raozihei TaxID=2500547 RepID=UPI000FE3E3C6|nr:tyrosine-protein kinase [Apibacter raozihei]
MKDSNTEYPEESNIDIKEVLYQYLIYWKWFVVSIVLMLSISFVYLKLTPKKYRSEAKILLNLDSDKGSSLLGLQDLTALTGSNGSKIEDQIEVLKSRRLMTKVIDSLDLNVHYYQRNSLITNEIYKEESPVTVHFLDSKSKYLVDSLYSFKIKVKDAKTFTYEVNDLSDEKTASFDKPIKFSFGHIIFQYNPLLKDAVEKNNKLRISIFPMNSTALHYIGQINVKANTKNGNIVNLEMENILPNNSNKIIDLLVSQYEKDIIEDKNKVGINTITFINDRLDLISKDLSTTDQSMEKFKSKKAITDIVTEGQISVQQSSKIDDQLKQYLIQLSLVNYMDNFIRNNRKSLVPSNIGLTDPSIAQATQQYNQLVLERDNLLKSSTEENPIIVNLDSRLKEFNNNLISSLRNYKSTTELAIGNLKSQLGEVKGSISELPSKERGFRDIARKQQTIEALYLLLLQKREETEISTASTPNVVKVVDKSFYTDRAVSPKKNLVILFSLVFGVLIPVVILYIRFILDNKVKFKKDIEKVITNIPISGYIPHSKDELIDINSANSPSAEAFRVLRTDINFLLPGDKNNSKCIYITSTISGEGKTYVAVNLAYTLALTNKKVLIIEADIRKPKVREYLKIKENPNGITEYLSENISNLNDNIIIAKYPQSESIKIDIFPSGRKAPNPSELFMNGRFKDIVDYGLENYDFVIVDTAPVSAVTDTLLINDYANLLLYVVRSNYLDKKLLEIPEQLYKDKKLKNHKTAILINDVDMKNGFNYGYGYGYGYSDQDKDIVWYKKIFNFKNKSR